MHADGEIWVAVEIDLRDLFLQRYPSSGNAEDIACVRGQQNTNTCPGDRRWIQDYYDSMVIMPRGPTMTQARDAMLAADMGRFGGANQDLIWQGFAMRGFGNALEHGQQRATRTRSRTSRRRMANNATVNFFADSKDGSAVPVNAQIFVGDYSARSTQIADTNPATVNYRHRRHRQPRQHGAVRPDRGGLAGRQERPLGVLQLRRSRARLRPRALPGEAPGGRGGSEHHDPHADQLRVGDAGRDGHDRRSRNRDERDPQRT